MDIIVLAYLGFIAGVVLRTLYDYLFKLLEDPNLAFDRKYLVTMLISLIIAAIGGTALFSSLPLPPSGAADFYVVIASFATGFMTNALINKPVTYLANAKHKEKHEP